MKYLVFRENNELLLSNQQFYIIVLGIQSSLDNFNCLSLVTAPA